MTENIKLIDLSEYSPIPHHAKKMYLEGKINMNEFITYLWLVLRANPDTGIVEVSFKGLEADFNSQIKSGYLKKIVKKLLYKKLVYYSRQGRKQELFQVWIVDFVLSSGETNSLVRIIKLVNDLDREKDGDDDVDGNDTGANRDGNENDSDHDKNQSGTSPGNTPKNEASPPGNIPDLQSLKNLLPQPKNGDSRSGVFPTNSQNFPYSNNSKKSNSESTNNCFIKSELTNSPVILKANNSAKNELNTGSTSLTSGDDLKTVEDFKPKSFEEERCQVIAKALGEKYINFVLAMKNKHGLEAIETAYRDTTDAKDVKEPRKYFNALLSRFITKRNN